ncbi:hypothetical protein KCU73_g172, partial [Aureobasidium melanogenum]
LSAHAEKDKTNWRDDGRHPSHKDIGEPTSIYTANDGTDKSRDTHDSVCTIAIVVGVRRPVVVFDSHMTAGK